MNVTDPVEAELFSHLDSKPLDCILPFVCGEPDDGSMAVLGELRRQVSPLPREFFDRLSEYYLDPNLWEGWQLERARKILAATPVIAAAA
ncbi:hypothetical protein [Corynebacterium pacaense]|uniref:hypothetical protein n=1 Tax=Corynebacterium pacaense TaxID=1816684 RepID=UPI001178B915|nr:hypothetical protein [Corynebacterium pacaense]